MDLIAATRAEGGLVFYPAIYISTPSLSFGAQFEQLWLKLVRLDRNVKLEFGMTWLSKK